MSEEYDDITLEILRGIEAYDSEDDFDVVPGQGYLKSKNKKYNIQTGTFEHADPNKSYLDSFKEGFRLDDIVSSFSPDENTAASVVVDTGTAAARAVVNIGQSLTELGGLGLTQLGVLNEEDFMEFNQNYKDLETKLTSGVLKYDNETYGTIVETISQYLVPGVGIYKMFDNVLKIPGLKGIVLRGLGAETALVTAVAPADEGNFATFLKDTFNVNEETSGKIIGGIVEYLGEVSNDPTAAGVAEQKFKNILGDSPIGILAELIVPVVKLAAKAKNNAQSTTSNISSDSPLNGRSSDGTTGLDTDSNAEGPSFSVGTKDEVGSSQTTDTLSDDTDNILSSSSKNNGTDSLKISIQDKVYHTSDNLEELLDIHKKTFKPNQDKIAELFNLKVVNPKYESGGQQAETFGRVKKQQSISDKMTVKNKNPSEMGDLQGHRILIPGTFKEAKKQIENEIIPKLKENFEVLDVEYKPHIGSYHAQVVNPNNPSTTMEIQIRPGKINKLIDKSHIPYAERKKYTQTEWDSNLIRKFKNKSKSAIIRFEVDLKTGASKTKSTLAKGAVVAGLGATAKQLKAKEENKDD